MLVHDRWSPLPPAFCLFPKKFPRILPIRFVGKKRHCLSQKTQQTDSAQGCTCTCRLQHILRFNRYLLRHFDTKSLIKRNVPEQICLKTVTFIGLWMNGTVCLLRSVQHAVLTCLNLTLLNLQQNCKNVTNLLIQCLVKYY